MRFSDLPNASSTVLQVRPLAADVMFPKLNQGDEVLLAPDPATEFGALLTVGSRTVEVAAANSRQEQVLADILPAGERVVWWVLRPGSKNLALQHAEFVGRRLLAEPITIGYGDLVAEEVRNRLNGGATDQEIAAWLRQRFLLPALALGSERQTKPRMAATYLGEEISRGFSILGDTVTAHVKEQNGRLEITTLAPPARSDEAAASLVECECLFKDIGTASVLREETIRQLEELTATSRGYLRVWERYSDLVESMALDRLRSLGYSSYESVTSAPGRWRFHLTGRDASGFLDALRLEDSELLIEATTRSPTEFLRDQLLDANQSGYVGALALVPEGEPVVELKTTKDGDRPPPRGFLRASFINDAAQQKRRRRAIESIRTSRAGIGYLGALIEDLDVGFAPRRKVEPLSPGARSHFPGGQPTESQRLALDVALNTPDIAVIQGPPGTGKTAVIAALQTRLAELEESQRSSGRTLLTSYQHDAVDLVASKTRVLGLPPLRVGGRHGGEVGVDEGFNAWRSQTVASLRADVGKGVDMLNAAWEVDAIRLDLASPSTDFEKVSTGLARIREITNDLLDPALRARLAEVEAELRDVESAPVSPGDARNRDRLTHLITHLTDYSASALDAAMQVRTFLARDSRTALQPLTAVSAIADWIEEDDPPLDLRTAAIEEAAACLALLAPGQATKASDLDEVLAVVSRAYRDAARRGADAVDLAVAQLAESLEYDEEGCREIQGTYSTVWAATCQQSDSGAMHAWKERTTLGSSFGDRSFDFETVIVDEAARANPLDLMIPMTKARRRIVLVGDQRQLPHILEDDVEQQMTEGLAGERQDVLKESLFERLFRQLKGREGRDKVIRVVTLDTQFRMHPVLGTFVSETFYGGPDALKPGAPEGEFAHGLTQFGESVAAWVDLPMSRGSEQRGRSKSRSAEADLVCDLFQSITAEKPDLSVGLITFYAAQRDLIARRLISRGLAQYENGVLRFARKIGNARLGTVDAFQGMEFDVVLLSIVRSNDLPALTERERRAKWGFLMLENRMNVAMSRQRRLLVAVGDPGMIEGESAAESISPLVRFRQLCEGVNGRVITPHAVQ